MTTTNHNLDEYIRRAGEMAKAGKPVEQAWEMVRAVFGYESGFMAVGNR